MNRKTTKLLTSVAVGVAAYWAYNQFFGGASASTSGLGAPWRQGGGYGAWGGSDVDSARPDTFSSNPYGRRYMPRGYGSGFPGYGNYYDPRVTEAAGGIAAQSALLDAMEGGN